MVLSPETRAKLDRVIREHRSVRPIRSHGLSPRRKLLLVGKPGTGKTLTASALAGDLGLPLFVVHLDGLITKFMGETAAKLRLVFDAMSKTRAVYLFDEFDSIGSERGLGNDVGEIRRVVSSFLQMVEQDNSDSLVIAATNHIKLLDRALFRRFDDLIRFELPNSALARLVLKSRLSSFHPEKINFTAAARVASGLSYADITRATEDAIKNALINNRDAVAQADLIAALKERRLTIRKKRNAD
jgi:SpoVK/Ycf46/Vps4 family AAA+-type ATPase